MISFHLQVSLNRAGIHTDYSYIVSHLPMILIPDLLCISSKLKTLIYAIRNYFMLRQL